MKESILVCVIGKTPQILSETLYCLWTQEEISVSEIYVITTDEGNKLIKEYYFPFPKGILSQLSKDYNYTLSEKIFTEDNIVVLSERGKTPLSDIRNTKDNELSQQIIMDTIRDFTENDSIRLLCSIAGGRKTMGIHLAYALQLFGREDDRLFHVLVHPSLENNRNFFYPRPNEQYDLPEGEEIIELAELPFIRLRDRISGLVGLDKVKYQEWVRMVQKDLGLTPALESVVLNTKKRKVIINDSIKVKLQPQRFSIFELFLRERVENCRRPERPFCSDCTECYCEIGEGFLTKDNIVKNYERYVRPKSPYIDKFEERLKGDVAKTGKTMSDVLFELIAKIKKRFTSMELLPYKEYLFIKSIGTRSRRYGIPLEKKLIKIV